MIRSRLQSCSMTLTVVNSLTPTPPLMAMDGTNKRKKTKQFTSDGFCLSFQRVPRTSRTMQSFIFICGMTGIS
ncbi:hypothetical protein TgHK011_000560 [Trichoderma gracile]|nr:hypothetical protein TgHK011_000560 [Trichoderma gracile]